MVDGYSVLLCGLCGGCLRLSPCPIFPRFHAVILLYGEKDTANKNASIELAELLKNVELKTIIGAGHEVNIESPQELAEILHAFYERMS